MFDISEENLPRLVAHAIKARGWRWDASAQEWRKHDDQGNNRSHNAADHATWFAHDIALAVNEAEAEFKQQASQMNATPGDTGTQALGNGNETSGAGAKEETIDVAADPSFVKAELAATGETIVDATQPLPITPGN